MKWNISKGLGYGAINQAAAGRCSRVSGNPNAQQMASPENNTDLLQYIARSLGEEEEFHFLRFEKLQRTNIVAQQMQLFELRLKFENAQSASDDDLSDLKNSLKDYGASY